jgi:hypothetical protein
VAVLMANLSADGSSGVSFQVCSKERRGGVREHVDCKRIGDPKWNSKLRRQIYPC